MLESPEETTAKPPLETDPPEPICGPEVFLLDDTGRITGCSTHAARWWDLDAPATLVGMHLTELFVPTGIDTDATTEDAPWEQLRAIAPTPIPATANTVHGDIPVEITLRRTTTADNETPTGYLAVIQPLPSPQPAGTPAADRPPSAGEPRLHDTALATFELDLAAGSARFSPAWWALLGETRPPESPTPEHLFSALHPEDTDALPRADTTGSPESEQRFSAEVRLANGPDSWIWVQLEGACSYDVEGALQRLSGIAIDITQRHELDEEIIANEARFFRLVRGGAGAFFELDFEQDTALFSPEFAHALGRTTAELGSTPDSFLALLDAGEAPLGAQGFFAALDEEQSGPLFRYTLHHADGRALEFLAYIRYQRNRFGALTGVSAIQFPAPSAPEPEEAIPQSLARAALTAIEAAGECVAILDQDGTTRHANTRFAQLVGKPLESIIGRAFAEVVSLVHRSDGNPAHRLLDSVLSGGPQIVLDHTLAVASGETSEDIIISAVPLQGDRARPEGAIVLIRRPLEMPRSPAELVASNRIEGLGQMASGIAHDFNNLLTTIAGGINLGIQRKDWPSVQVAEKACRSAQTLARQLLTFARGPTGNRKVGDIRKTIEETTRMAAAGTSATIDLDLADDLHPVEFDPVQMVQVFTNLLINAVQALNDDGTIAIRAISVALAKLNALDLPPGDYVRIEIQDNGPGIAPEDLERIFQPFFTTRKDGTGLGLSVARSIIAQHNGTITVESTPGEGTTFTIHLPRANKDIVTEERTAPSLPRGSGRVLIMDDDTDLCMIATGILSMLGYEPDEAHNGEEAIKKYRRTMEIGRPYDVVILDLTVPGGMGGEAVLNELKKLDPQVCAVVSSGYVTEEQANHYRSLGFAGILAKPYRTAELGQVLKDVLAARSNPDAE